MKNCNVLIRVTGCILFIFIIHLCHAQTKRNELESQRKALEKEIKSTTEILQKTQKSKSKSLNHLKALNVQIAQRQELLASINKELAQVSKEAESHEQNKKEAEATIAQLESRMENALRTAYVRSQIVPKWIYLLSAASIGQALTRWVYLRQYKNYIMGQLHALQEKKYKHQLILAQLEENKKIKTALFLEEEKEKKEIDAAKRSQEQMVTELGREEKKLRTQLKSTESKKKKLDEEIARLIREETKKVSTAGLTSAPETKALNEQFASNKGKLPWPVGKGIVTGKFGNHPHPVLKGIMIQNNGIDIQSEPQAPVKSLFNGTVASVTRIPGYDYMVMIRHGLYFTVYSRIAQVSVKKGDSVTTGQSIGTLGTDEPVLHLEIWKDKTKLNPESWIAKK